MVLRSQEGLQHSGLHEKEHHHQVKGGDLSPLLSIGKAATGVLCPVQQRHGLTETGPATGHKVDQRSGQSAIEKLSVGTVQPGEEKVQGGSSQCVQIFGERE